MPRPKSDFLKAMGTGWEIFQAIANEVLSLGGNDEHLRRILKDGKLRRDIANLIMRAAGAYPTYKTIGLGTGLETAEDFRIAIKEAGSESSYNAEYILSVPAFKVATNETVIELVNISVTELGLNDSATFSDIVAKALSLGLALCPAEVGPQLRLQYADQPMYECLVIGMEPMAGRDGRPYVLVVGHDDDGLWLDVDNGSPDCDEDRYIFVRHK